MARSLATYIALPGTTGEAMEHWQEVFGGDLQILRYADVALEGMPFEPDPQAVAHATLTLPAGVIAGGDAMDQEKHYPVRDTAYSLLLTADTAAEARGYIEKLIAAGGSVQMPFDKAPWGGWYGEVFDRYGVMWGFWCEEA